VLRSLLFVCGLFPLVMGTANAQRQVLTWPPLAQLSTSAVYLVRSPTPLDAPRLAEAPSDTTVRQIEPTHWKEGGLVGAVVLGAFGVWFGNEICRNADDISGSCARAMIGGGVGGGVLGFLIGALIGGQFPKHPSSVTTQEPANGSVR
jgi:hypothetical protein